jgi:glutathione-specific gamma-glutamylcyclotransferase
LSTAKRPAPGAADRNSRAGAAAPMPEAIAALADAAAPVWLFAYGSLIWDRDFDYVEAVPALLRGYHRSCCLYSFDYRGTPARPGLVLGLDRGGSCRGIAFRLAARGLAGSLEKLWEREMTAPSVYHARQVPVRTGDGRHLALAFTVRRDRPDYAGRLPPDEAARLIASARGRRGSCRDYLRQTLHHLAVHGIVDIGLYRLAERVAAIAANPDDQPVPRHRDGARLR